MSRPVHHPAPANIGKYLAHIAAILQAEERHDNRKSYCRCIECVAKRLASHGWPASTIGDGRGGNHELTAVEAAADSKPLYATAKLAYGGQIPMDLDVRLAKAMRTLWASARVVEDTVALIRRHGNDSEQVAGLGHCTRCAHFCNPRTNPRDRRVKGLCPGCLTGWYRWLKDNPHGLPPDYIRTYKPKAS